MDEKSKLLIDNCEIISFDVFDTLIVRPFTTSKLLPRYIAKQNSDKFYVFKRTAREIGLRILSFITGSEGEIKAEELLKFKNMELFQQEMEFDLNSVKPNAYAKELFEYAKSNNKRIIITSDMYYSKEFIISLLNRCGYEGFERVFVSSEYGKTKFFGSLFSVINKELEIKEPKKILHIGDNRRSDIKNAKKVGWTVLYMQKPYLTILNTEKRLKRINSKSLVNSMIIGLLAQNYCSDVNEHNFWETFGYRCAGPIIFGFTKEIERVFKRDNFDYILFIARDGYAPMHVLNTFSDIVNVSYIYAQRMICTSCDMESFKKYPPVKFMRYSPLLSFLYSYKDKVPYKESDINTYRKAKKFLYNHKDTYKALAEETDNQYKDYLFHTMGIDKNEASKKHKVLCVDSVSTYKSAQRLIEKTLDGFADVCGHYFWFIPLTSGKKNTKQYVPFLCSMPVMRSFGIMAEFMMTSPEHRVLGLDDNYQPIFRSDFSQYEVNKSEAYKKMMIGIKQYAIDFSTVFGKTCDITFSGRSAAKYLKLICKYGSEKDKQYFAEVEIPYHNDIENTTITPVPLWKIKH